MRGDRARWRGAAAVQPWRGLAVVEVCCDAAWREGLFFGKKKPYLASSRFRGLQRTCSSFHSELTFDLIIFVIMVPRTGLSDVRTKVRPSSAQNSGRT